MIITKMSLPRRTFLRGVGSALALPLLDAMVPAATALAQTAASPTKRLGFIYIPNGANMGRWTPSTDGALELSPTLSPLAPVRDQVVIPTGLAHRQAEAWGDGNGEHSRASGVWLNASIRVAEIAEPQDERQQKCDERDAHREKPHRVHRVLVETNKYERTDRRQEDDQREERQMVHLSTYLQVYSQRA